MFKTLPMKCLLVLFIIAAILWGPSFSADCAEKKVIGWVENVHIYPGNILIEAKIDTGAENSSLNAAAIEKFSRDGEKWVRFNVVDSKGGNTSFEQKVVRWTKIKEHVGESPKRPVVRLGICLGGIYKDVEVNLVDRSNFMYQLLVGRSFLAGSFVVDADLMSSTDSGCRGATSP